MACPVGLNCQLYPYFPVAVWALIALVSLNLVRHGSCGGVSWRRFCLLALPSTSPGNARRVSTKLEKGDAAGFGRNANPGRNRPGQPFAPADDRIVIDRKSVV